MEWRIIRCSVKVLCYFYRRYASWRTSRSKGFQEIISGPDGEICIWLYDDYGTVYRIQRMTVKGGIYEKQYYELVA